MTLINLTPHDLVIYPRDTPDRVDPAVVQPVQVIPPSAEHKPARLDEVATWDTTLNAVDCPVRYVTYGCVQDPPPRIEGTCYVVSLVTGLACPDRADFLVPYAEVRHAELHHVIGCRMLARPMAWDELRTRARGFDAITGGQST